MKQQYEFRIAQVVLRRSYNPLEGKGFCSSCHKRMEGNVSMDGVIVESVAKGKDDRFYFLCLLCARAIGKLAEVR